MVLITYDIFGIFTVINVSFFGTTGSEALLKCIIQNMPRYRISFPLLCAFKRMLWPKQQQNVLIPGKYGKIIYIIFMMFCLVENTLNRQSNYLNRLRMMTSSNGNLFRVIGPLWGQWRGALMFILNFAWTNGWANNRDTGDLRCRRAHYYVTVMLSFCTKTYAFIFIKT